MSTKQAHSKEILGVRIDFGLSMKEVLAHIEQDLLLQPSWQHVCTTNPEFVLLAQEKPDFKDVINSSPLSVPDGVGVLLANEYLDLISRVHIQNRFFRTLVYFGIGIRLGFSLLFHKKAIGERITGVALVEELCKLSAEKGYTIVFLGGWPQGFGGKPLETSRDLASEAADALRAKYPGVNIIGASSQFSYKSEGDVDSLSYIHDAMQKASVSSVDFLFVAYPQYHQEKWIVRNAVEIPAKVSIGVGRSFNYYSKYLSSPPELFTKLHLEWLYSVLREPWRVRRVFRAVVGFSFTLFRSTLHSN
jgi:N-acetylglucosaminyldiphosphoundecaprenol N-acetyl-beta-D-mannosaminyltransferase